jgi:hypothetical protein
MEERNATNHSLFGSPIDLGHISEDGLLISVTKNVAFLLVIDPALQVLLLGPILSGILCTG